MNLQELKAMSRADALAAADTYAGVEPGVHDSIWRKESTRGLNMVGPETEHGTAKGHFQMLDKTAATWEKRLGTKLDRFDFHESLWAAANQMKENRTATADTAEALAMYHGGTERKNWGPKTAAYVKEILGQELPAPAAQASRKAKLNTSTLTPEMARGMTLEDIQALGDPLPEVDKYVRPVLLTPNRGDATGASTLIPEQQRQYEAERQADWDKRNGVSFGTKIAEGYRKAADPTFRFISRLNGNYSVGPANPEFAEGLAADPTKLIGFEQEEREILLDSANEKDFAFRKDQILLDRERNQSIYATGGVAGFTAELIGGLAEPGGFVAGMGVGKAVAMAGLGARALAQAGRAGAAVASTAAENALGNVAYGAALQIAGDHRTVADYAMDATTGAVMGLAFSRGTYKDAMLAHASNARDAALKSDLDNLQEAIKRVGPDADEATLKRTLNEIESEKIKNVVNSGKAGAEEADRIPARDPVELMDEYADAPAEPVAEASVPEVKAPPEVPASQFLNRDAWLTQEIIAPAMTEQWKADYGLTLTPQEQRAHGTGAHLDPSVSANAREVQAFAKIVDGLVKKYADGLSLTLTSGAKWLDSANALGGFLPTGKSSGVLMLRNREDAFSTAIHEVGHAIAAWRLNKVDTNVRDDVLRAYHDWMTSMDHPDGTFTALGRWSAINTKVNGYDNLDKPLHMQVKADQARARNEKLADGRTLDYVRNFDEWTAEQFVKHIEKLYHDGSKEAPKLPKKIRDRVMELFDSLKELFTKAKSHGLLGADARFETFLKAELQSMPSPAVMAMVEPSAAKVAPSTQLQALRQSADAKRFGLDSMPLDSPVARAEFRIVLEMHKKAEQWAKANPVDAERLKALTAGNRTFGSTGINLAGSANPLARMIAGTLLEVTTGAQGRRTTAAIAAAGYERQFIGNTLNVYQDHYATWRKLQGQSWIADVKGNELRGRFDKLVAAEIEARGTGNAVQSHPLVVQAADALEAGYDRMRVTMQDVGAVGFARLGETSRGYMPHMLAAETVRDMTNAQRAAFIDSLKDQFMQNQGWDAAFSAELARKYMDHAIINANGGHEIPANVHSPAAADMVRDALLALNMPKQDLEAIMGKFSRGGASFTKKRLHLDLNKQYDDNGTPFTLLDLFNTDQLSLYRNYARRAAGETALMQNGVAGSQGLKLIRRAMMFGEEGKRASVADMEAFDQIAAEFLGQPFGTASGKWADRAMSANALVSLGGNIWSQLGETINAAWSVGINGMMDSIASAPRIRSEILALAKGQKVDSILNSIEGFGGQGEFGMDGYKLVMPYDTPNNAHEVYGADTPNMLDRMLRAGAHAQGVVNFWRATTAIQQRGMAEQITKKAIRYITEGKSDKALRDMGITADVAARLKADMPNMTVYNNGKLVEFDLSKAQDVHAARAFAHTVSRGTKQIIQGTFIGETGAWAHSGLLKLMTQFRSFPLISMEKQWARQKANHGLAGALGMMAGSMSMVLPIVAARVAAGAVGRKDKEAYIEKNMNPLALARASLNYIAMSGFAGELVDALGSLTGQFADTGGRSGAQRGIASNIVPALGLAENAWKAATDLDSPHKIAAVLPFSRLPGAVQVFNLLRPE
jgi:hypothetical protein